MKPKYDKLVSNFAFNVNLRHYIKEAVVTSGLPLVRPQLKVKDFVGSVERLAWAELNGCPWDTYTWWGGAGWTLFEIA